MRLSAVHAADPEHVPKDRKQVQGFMYHCPDKNSNIYAYPLPWTPILDVETRKVWWFMLFPSDQMQAHVRVAAEAFACLRGRMKAASAASDQAIHRARSANPAVQI